MVRQNPSSCLFLFLFLCLCLLAERRHLWLLAKRSCSDICQYSSKCQKIVKLTRSSPFSSSLQPDPLPVLL